ncbi:MAG: hypothetical protein ACXADY_03875 [Candidatus Hodarchaeales archaeon]|jgi:hypothetical protein
MTQGIRMQRHGITILFLIISILCGSVIQSSSHSSVTAAKVLQAHQVVDTLTAYQTEQFTVSLSITNVYGWQDILNVSITVYIPEEVEFLYSSESDLDQIIESDTDRFDHNFGTLRIDETIHFSANYNVTSDQTKSITIRTVNVSYQLENGIIGNILTNTQEIGLRGRKLTTTPESILPIPIGKRSEIDLGGFKIPAIQFFSIVGYLLPLMVFSMNIIIFRRIRYLRP